MYILYCIQNTVYETCYTIHCIMYISLPTLNTKQFIYFSLHTSPAYLLNRHFIVWLQLQFLTFAQEKTQEIRKKNNILCVKHEQKNCKSGKYS